MTFSPLSLPVFASGIVAVVMAAAAWPRRAAPAGRAFSALALALVAWCLPYGLSLMSTTPAEYAFWWRLKYVGVTGASMAWLVTALAYTGQRRWLTPPFLALLAVVPAITLILAWTNPAHGLIHARTTFTRNGSLLVAHVTHGPAFWVHAGIAYCYLFTGAALFAQAAHRALRVYRMQALALLLAAVAPWAGNGLYLAGVGPFERLDPTPIGVTLSGLFIALAFLRFRLFDLVPVARAHVIEAMRDGMLVLDATRRVVDLNPRALRILGESDLRAVGRPAHELLPALAPGSEFPREIFLGHGAHERTYELSVSALTDGGSQTSGHVILLSDVTERRRAELQREELIHQLREALGEVKTLSGLLPVCAWCHNVRDDRGYWEQIESFVSRHSAAQFSHGICPDCAAKFERDHGLRRD